ncbi:tetratricopeptide repeat protein [Allosphingosinicella sp.]|uniref:tetratricopeptide repeat protein n=1 Tax=Allosphingosinicella sp. TaxID=2823234 RepID=UPI002FC18687
MISLLLALAAVQAEPPAQSQTQPLSDQEASAKCAGLVKSDAEQAVVIANDWLVKGGGMFARQCAGQAYAALGRWEAAAGAFAEAAKEAETSVDPRRADFWVQAGNAWLAAGNGARAREAFDKALATALLTPQLRGEVYLDRGRAGVLLNDMAGARSDINEGLQLVPDDPFGWYISSALALKEGLLARAQDDIAEAVRLAPEDPNLLVHAGNVAGISGEIEAAKGLYAKAIRVAPDSDAAKAARAALAANASPPDNPPQPQSR